MGSMLDIIVLKVLVTFFRNVLRDLLGPANSFQRSTNCEPGYIEHDTVYKEN